MLKDEYDARAVLDLFSQLNSPIAASYDSMKKFVYKNLLYGSSGTMSELATECGGTQTEMLLDAGAEDFHFFYEHPLVDELDLLLDAYYEVINEEMFKLLNMTELKCQFETQLGFVLMQRGDFYESLIDYLLPLLRKPASEVVNIVAGSCTNLHRIFHMFMVNAKLIDLSQVYKIDSLLYNNYEIRFVGFVGLESQLTLSLLSQRQLGLHLLKVSPTTEAPHGLGHFHHTLPFHQKSLQHSPRLHRLWCPI